MLSTGPGPGNDAQHPQGRIYVKGCMGDAGLTSGPGCRVGKVRVSGQPFARPGAKETRSGCVTDAESPCELLGQGPLGQGLLVKAQPARFPRQLLKLWPDHQKATFPEQIGFTPCRNAAGKRQLALCPWLS